VQSAGEQLAGDRRKDEAPGADRQRQGPAALVGAQHRPEDEQVAQGGRGHAGVQNLVRHRPQPATDDRVLLRIVSTIRFVTRMAVPVPSSVRRHLGKWQAGGGTGTSGEDLVSTGLPISRYAAWQPRDNGSVRTPSLGIRCCEVTAMLKLGLRLTGRRNTP